MAEKKNGFLFLALLGLMMLGTFSNIFQAEFVNWDDNVFIFDNGMMRYPFWDALQSAFTTFYHADYLPFSLISFWIDTHLHGPNPYMSHFENLFFHFINVILLFIYLSKLGLRKSHVRILCVVFALHPVQNEMVMWVSGRNSIFCLFFLLLSALAAQSRRSFLTFLFFTLSFGCKSIGILFPLCLVTADWAFRQDTLKVAVKRYIPLYFISLLALALRIYSFKRASTPDFAQVTWDTERLIQLPVVMFSALGRYWKMVLMPWGYTIIYPRFEMGSAAIMMALLGLAIFGFFTWRAFKNKQYWFYLVIVFSFLLPVLQILPRINFINERYLYFSVIAFVGLVLTLWEELVLKLPPQKTKYLSLFGYLFLALLPVFAFARSEVWINDHHLWSDTVQKNDKSTLALNNLGMALSNKNRTAEAVAIYKQAIERGDFDGTLSLVYNNLATIYLSPESLSYFSPQEGERLLKEGITKCTKLEDCFTLRYNLAYYYSEGHDQGVAVTVLTGLIKDIESMPGREKYDALATQVRARLAKVQGH